MSLDLDPTQWGALDAELFHLPQINWFIEWGVQWDYPAWSATGPGIHWVMAALAWLTGAEALDLGSWQTAFGPAFLTAMALLFLYAALRSSGASPMRTLVIGFPLVSSSYFWNSSSVSGKRMPLDGWTFRDGLHARRVRQPLVFSLAAATSTIARQNFLSTAGAFWLMEVVEQWPQIITWRMVGHAALTLGPSLLVVAGLMAHWGGLTPPEWQEVHVGLSPGPVLHGLMLLGVFGWLFLREEDLAGDLRARTREVAIIAAVALMFWLLVPENGGPRPNSIVWRAAAFLPVTYGRPLLTLPLLILGMVVAFAYWRRGLRDGFRLSPELSLFACYFAAQAAQRFSWQRYAEIPVLLLLCVGMARLRQKILDRTLLCSLLSLVISL